jgi:Protein of unknown function (DUF3710)
VLDPVLDDSELDPRWITSSRTPIVGTRKSSAGPYDTDDPDAPDADGALDFGSLRVPMPARAQLQVEKGTGELLRAVHVLVPSGRVSLSALAAPRSSPLWRELADEIAGSLTKDGARVRSEWGEWGREVQAGSNGALSRFIGVDGPRWMLYGVATGPAEGAAELAHTLREMIRSTVVIRGVEPLPVKTVLPLRLPEHLEELVEEAREHTALRSDVAPVVEVDVECREPDADWAEPWPADYPSPGSPVPRQTPEFDQGRIGRSIGIRRSEPRRVSGRMPPSLPPAAHAGLPPVSASSDSIDSIDTGGSPRVPVESTWSKAIPVVSSDEVERQPAWAELSDAPSYWLRPRPVDDPLDGQYSGYLGDQYGVHPGDFVPESPDRRALDDLGFGLPPTGLDPLPVEPGLLPSAPVPGWPWEADLLPGPRPGAIHDSLHDTLTSDTAVAQNRLPKVERRARHRRPD